MPDDFERMWGDLAPIGRSARSGGYFRQPFTAPEQELRAWFVEQCAARGLRVETDGFGNVVGWWDAGSGPGVLTGSHLDSVLDAGAYDGPLGVVSALAAVDLMRARGVVPSRSVGVSVFTEEEGSRFGLACLGSRLAVGATSWETARSLTDRDGVALGDVVEGGSSSLLSSVGTFVELHVEQGRDLVDRGAAVGVASEIWPHGRYRFDFAGAANHAGTTRMEDRADPMLTYAFTALGANKQARLAGQRATFGRVSVEPNGTNAVPSLVTAWLDARCSTDAGLASLVEAIEAQASDRAGRDGTQLTVTAESVSGSVAFDPALAALVAADHEGGDWPIIPTQAGHDAGILSAAGIPT
ncbi:MAG: allantoate amidohydrolase, partial [Actinomycetales bacterium]